jgi:indole-3-glycerol phosphate synthase
LDHLARLSEQAKKRVSRGYYDNASFGEHRRQSLVHAIAATRKTPIIAEVKFASPSLGQVRHIEPPLKIAKAMLSGGAVALSVLTDPDDFRGGLKFLSEITENVQAPIIMKDIIVSPQQVRAAAQFGADAIVLISELFSRGLADFTIDEIQNQSRQLGLEVIIESHESSAFEKSRALKPDLYGINNRDLSTFEVDISTTERVLRERVHQETRVVSESGIESADDVRRLKVAGAKAFLIGTSIMRAPNIEEKVREFVDA